MHYLGEGGCLISGRMDLSNYVLSHIPSVLKLSGLIVSKGLYLRDLSDLVVVSFFFSF